MQHADTRRIETGPDVVRRIVPFPGDRPVGAWTSDLRRSVEEHPLRALAAAIAIGYVAGKVLRRPR